MITKTSATPHNLRPGRALALSLAGLLLSGLVLSGCGGGLGGTWDSTADLGAETTLSLVVLLPESGFEGTITVSGDDGEKREFKICGGSDGDDGFALRYDPAKPDCNESKPEGQRALRGTLGADVIYGKVFDGDKEVGIFRGFRRPPAEPVKTE
jgi:hypothetical protein